MPQSRALRPLRLNALALALAATALLHGCASPQRWAQESYDDSPRAAVHDGAEDRRAEIVVAAMGALGTPYRYGGGSYEGGFDCSGFVRAVYQQTWGLTLPRQSAQQARATRAIARRDLQPGDLVFFNTVGQAFSHVGIYVGDERFIHSPKAGASVRIENMRLRYWDDRFNAARRVSPPS
ncbi:C40 family peptidase [Hylemonella sp. W303a]|uniref:C40 family peptidase n=1 Tax=Hylemonella sp. W303a TaxID=3389873 RepID=UPI00396AFAF0